MKNVFYADWLIFLFCCKPLPGKYKYFLGNTGISKLVLAIIHGAFESVASQATKSVNSWLYTSCNRPFFLFNARGCLLVYACADCVGGQVRQPCPNLLHGLPSIHVLQGRQLQFTFSNSPLVLIQSFTNILVVFPTYVAGQSLQYIIVKNVLYADWLILPHPTSPSLE